MNLKRLLSIILMLISAIAISNAQNNKLSYGYVEKTSIDQLTTHFAHIILDDNQIIMNRIVIYADSTTKELGRQELIESYCLTGKEIKQLDNQLTKILENSKMPVLAKVKKKKMLLSKNIESEIDLNSKRNLLLIGNSIYYLEYDIKLGKERDAMSDKEVDNFMELEDMLEEIAKPIQQIYSQKCKDYRRPF